MPRSIEARSPALARTLQVVHAAGVGGGLPGPACAPNSCPARSAAARRRRTSVDSRVATPSASNAAERKPRGRNGPLLDREPVREQPRARRCRAGSWRGGTARRRTPRRAGGRPASAPSPRRTAPAPRRSAGGADPAAPPCARRRCGRSASGDSRSPGASADAVPAVALHRLALAGDQRAADAVRGAALARRRSRASWRTR